MENKIVLYNMDRNIAFLEKIKNKTNPNLINDFIRREILKFQFGNDEKLTRTSMYITKKIVKELLCLKKCQICRDIQKPVGGFGIMASNVPQFSNLLDGTSRICDILKRSGDVGMSYEEIGLYLTSPGKNKGAYIKYGENHSKLANLFDLVYIDKMASPNTVYLTPLGYVFINLKKLESAKLISLLSFRVPVLSAIFYESHINNTNISRHLDGVLAESTIKRRKPNIRLLITRIHDENLENKECYQRIEMS